jgi:phenylpyruvate tautomerase PptA (4-oxalocrotonate tautomerase family)
MPLWQLFVPEDAYTADDKLELGKRITGIYSDNFGDLPRFYTTVIFHELKPESFLVGGELRDSKFVQIAIVHAARTTEEVAERMGIPVTDLEQAFLKMVGELLRPYVADRGYEWELHVEKAPRETWIIDGMAPPPQWSEDEKRWARENKSSPLVAA